jgi:phage terminase large subunit-like protein
VASSERALRGPLCLPPGTDLLDYLISVDPEPRAEMVRCLGITDADAFDGSWPVWAHEGQNEPAACEDGSDWNVWVVKGGRGFGKTLTGSKWIEAAIAAADEPLHIALVGATLDDARRLMVEGRSGLLEVAGHCIREWRPSLGTLKFRGGSTARLFSGHTHALLRGPEHHIAWCDELAKWEEAQKTWDMLQLGLRLGTRPRILVTTTPRPGPVLKAIMAAPGCVVTGGPTRANPHLPDAFVTNVHNRYAGTRLARQELEGELLTDNAGALWTEALLTSCRAQGSDWGPIASQRAEPASVGQPAARSGDRTDVTDSLRDGLAQPPTPHESPTLIRIIIAIDPPTGDGTCGIVACAKDEAGNAHILADHSVPARTPEGWARAAADAAHAWGHLYTNVPVHAVAESNQGGAMVRAVLRTADPELRVKLVQARHGKAERASPVAILFEAGKVTLHGRFPELEAQLCGMIAGGGYEGPGASPDRADAMVWGLTELMLTPERPTPSVRRL